MVAVDFSITWRTCLTSSPCSTLRRAASALRSSACFASELAACKALTADPIFSVEARVCCASLPTSSATTLKPRPESPARAASMAAFKARRLVWSATSLMTSTISAIRTESLVKPLHNGSCISHGRLELSHQLQGFADGRSAALRIGLGGSGCAQSLPRLLEGFLRTLHHLTDCIRDLLRGFLLVRNRFPGADSGGVQLVRRVRQAARGSARRADGASHGRDEFLEAPRKRLSASDGTLRLIAPSTTAILVPKAEISADWIASARIDAAR